MIILIGILCLVIFALSLKAFGAKTVILYWECPNCKNKHVATLCTGAGSVGGTTGYPIPDPGLIMQINLSTQRGQICKDAIPLHPCYELFPLTYHEFPVPKMNLQ